MGQRSCSGLERCEGPSLCLEGLEQQAGSHENNGLADRTKETGKAEGNEQESALPQMGTGYQCCTAKTSPCVLLVLGF